MPYRDSVARRPRTVFLFGGQGSQFFGMGQSLYADHAGFRREVQRLDEVARSMLGRSVMEVVFDPERRLSEPFDDTLLSHPAIFIIEVALARTLMAEGVLPDVLMGASLGEFASLVVAGAVPVEIALRACIEQAQLFIAHCAPGGMIAILDDVNLYYETEWLHDGAALAAINFARHFVISAWLPDNRTSGTSCPRHEAGLV